MMYFEHGCYITFYLKCLTGSNVNNMVQIHGNIMNLI
jgi:hypothetical protein